MAVTVFPWLLLFALLAASSPAASLPATAQQESPPNSDNPGAAPMLPGRPPGAFKADPGTPTNDPKSDVWIFSGTLQETRETYSGTLVADVGGGSQFELKLENGATCAGGDLKGEIGLVRMSEIACSDGRPMRALFVPQGGQELKVFGHVGAKRFMTSAHLLGTEAPPEPKQTAQPKGPLGRPPPDTPKPPAPATAPKAPPPG